MNKLILILCLIVLNGLTTVLLGHRLSAEGLMSILDRISVFSTAVLAIIGIWIAVVFPSVLSSIFEDDEEKTQSLEKASKLLVPLVLIAIVAVLALAAELALLLLLGAPVPLTGATGLTLKQISLFLVLGLVEGSIIALFLAIAPGVQVLFDERKKHQRKARRRRMIGNRERQRK